MHACTYGYMFIHIYRDTCKPTYVCTYVCTCICMYLCNRKTVTFKAVSYFKKGMKKSKWLDITQESDKEI